MSLLAKKQEVLSVVGDWVGERAAFPLLDGESEEDEVELRLFDWGLICDEAKTIMLESIFNDSKPDDFAGLRKGGKSRDVVFEDSWLPIAIVGTGPVSVRGYDEPDYFPQFSSLLLVNLDEASGKQTALYCLAISGTAIRSKTVPRYEIGGVPQTLGDLELCEPIAPEDEDG